MDQTDIILPLEFQPTIGKKVKRKAVKKVAKDGIPKKPRVKKTEKQKNMKRMNAIRSALRQQWDRHPVKSEARKLAIVEKSEAWLNSKNSRKTPYRCKICEGIFTNDETEVDHLEPAGTLKAYSDVGPFANNLLNVTVEDVQILCISCHNQKTYSERNGCTFEESHALIAVAQFRKLKAGIQIEKLLASEVPEGMLKNSKTRCEAYLKYIYKTKQ